MNLNNFYINIIEYFLKVKNIRKVAKKFEIKEENVRFILRKYYLSKK
jgi:hypothetical protein